MLKGDGEEEGRFVGGAEYRRLFKLSELEEEEEELEEMEEAMESWRACESSAMLRLCRRITVGETFLTIGGDLSEESFLTIGEDPSVENFLSVGKGPSEETFLSGVDVTFSLFSVPLPDVSLSVAMLDALLETLSFTNWQPEDVELGDGKLVEAG